MALAEERELDVLELLGLAEVLEVFAMVELELLEVAVVEQERTVSRASNIGIADFMVFMTSILHKIMRSMVAMNLLLMVCFSKIKWMFERDNEGPEIFYLISPNRLRIRLIRF